MDYVCLRMEARSPSSKAICYTNILGEILEKNSLNKGGQCIFSPDVQKHERAIENAVYFFPSEEEKALSPTEPKCSVIYSTSGHAGLIQEPHLPHAQASMLLAGTFLPLCIDFLELSKTSEMKLLKDLLHE